MLVFASQDLPCWHPQSSQKLYFFKTPFWTISLMFLFRFYRKMLDLETPSKSSGRQNGTPNRPSGSKHLHFSSLCACLFPTHETLKHQGAPSGLDLRFAYDLHSFAFSNLRGTVVTKYMIFLVFASASIRSRNI